MFSRAFIGLAAAIVLWVGCLAAGFSALHQYSADVGKAYAPRNSEEFFAAHRQPNRPLLVMAAHPRCPCTSASLAEMADLLARSRGACDALLLQYHPENAPAGWSETALPRELGGVAVAVVLDHGGKIATALGAATSGHVVFADARGAVRFTGGITVSRGHRGRAPGQDAILEVLHGSTPTLFSAPAFGCALAPECKPPDIQ